MRRIMLRPSAGRHAFSAVLVALLLIGTGCAGKKKASETPPSLPPPKAIKEPSAISQESKSEAKLGFFTRLNPFSKKEKPPAEQMSEAEEKSSQDGNGKVKREQGVFSRWFGRSKELPTATPETFEERKVRTAKGEVSPPLFEYNGLELALGKTSKARIIATFGEPENIFFSEGAEEILIYRRIRRIDSLYIFLDSQGLVKDYIITKRQ